MIILSFDCAVENLGICCINFDDMWREKIAHHINKVNMFYEMLKSMSKDKFIQEAKKLLEDIDYTLNHILDVKFFNVVDLIPEDKLSETNLLERTKKLKYLLSCLDAQLPKPDVVLIEYQMKQNDISRNLSSQIAYHYTSFVDCKVASAVEKYKINDLNSLDALSICSNVLVELVGPSLKNQYKLAPDGDYNVFIEKYSNYVANKKHTTYNFKYFAEVYGYSESLQGIKNKVDDIADAFMMMVGWLKKTNYL